MEQRIIEEKSEAKCNSRYLKSMDLEEETEARFKISSIVTCFIRCLSCSKLSVEKARKVPPIVTESGMTLNASPP